MHKIHFIALSLALGLARPGAAQTASTETTTIAAAARTLLEKLSAEQRKQAVFDFKDDAQRKRWSNLPTGIFQRQGLRMGDLTPAQRDAVHALLAAALSPQGYEKVMQIVEGDEVLKQSGSQGPGRRDDRGPGRPNDSGPGSPGQRAGSGRPGGRGGPGGGLIFGRDEFYVSFLGIEFAPQRMGGDPNKHLHTIYRDPRNDYGAKWWKR